MKSLNKFILTLSLFLVTLTGFSQASNVDHFRIANATTAFGQNLPVGTTVYNVATQELWMANSGVASTATLTTAAASFDKANGTGESTTVSDTAEIDLTLTGSAIDANIVTGSIDVLKLDAGVQASLGNADTALQTEVDGDVSNEGQLTVTAGTGTTSVISSNSSGSTDVTIEVGANMTISESGNTITIASTGEANLTQITESFEEDDGTATAHSLSQTAIVAQSCRVSLNGAVLDPANYTFASGSITLTVPVYQYDKVVITYFY